MKKRISLLLLFILLDTSVMLSQNSMVGDGFGGRLWYKPSNYTVGSYSAYTICGDSCGANNQLYGWGGNGFGQLGNGSNISTTAPVAVIGMTNVRYYSTGYVMGAIKNDNTAWVWGNALNFYTVFSNTPQMVLTDVKFLDVGISVYSFVKTDGSVWSVGSNQFGEFGNGSLNSPTTIPSKMVGINTAVRVANGQLNNIVLLSNGTVLATGSNLSFGLGNGSIQDSQALIPIPGLTNIIDIKASTRAMIALDSSGNIYTWGTILNGGYIGNGTTNNSSNIPIKLNALNNIVAISGCNDGFHFLALDANHICYAWGVRYGAGNQMGTGAIVTPFVPIVVATNVIDIMAGETFSYIVKTDGSLWATGSSYGGSIWMNLPNNIQRDTFTQINPLIAPMNLCKPIAQYTAFAQATDATCANGGTITVTHTGGKAPYTYSIGNGFQSSNVFTNVSAGNYTVHVKDSVGCVSTVLTTVGSNTNAISNLSKTITHATCGKNNGVVNLGAVTGGVAPFQYNFNNTGFSSTQNYTNLSAGNYSIVVKDANGCNYNTNAIVSNIGTPTSTTISDTVCDGRIYNFNGKNITTTGTYTDTLVNAFNCDSIISLALFVTPIPNSIHLGTDTTLCEGDTLRLNATTANATFVWQDSSTLPYFIVTKDGIYHVSVKANCFNGFDTIQVTYKSCEETTCTYFIPNAFSPNGDGNNDEFKIRSNCELSGYLIIYNRLGNELFKTTNLSTGWNGKYKNELVQQDVYAYYAEFTLNGKTEKRKGNITLLR